MAIHLNHVRGLASYHSRYIRVFRLNLFCGHVSYFYLYVFPYGNAGLAYSLQPK